MNYVIIDCSNSYSGEIITIGSDAHTPDKIGYSFDKASDILTECGFKYYTIFEGRVPEYIKL